jgi:hypothetical protein
MQVTYSCKAPGLNHLTYQARNWFHKVLQLQMQLVALHRAAVALPERRARRAGERAERGALEPRGEGACTAVQSS